MLKEAREDNRENDAEHMRPVSLPLHLYSEQFADNIPEAVAILVNTTSRNTVL
jgi:hypothetical protein